MEHLGNLLDTIDDARYCVENMREHIEPEEKLKIPSPKETAAFVNKLQAEDPQALSFENLTSQPVGLFLFSQFAASRDEHSIPRMRFLEQVIQWGKVSKPEQRAKTACLIYNEFLTSDDSGKIVDVISPISSPDVNRARRKSASVERGKEQSRESKKIRYKLKPATMDNADVLNSSMYRSTIYRGFEVSQPVPERFTELSESDKKEIAAALDGATEYMKEDTDKRASSVMISSRAPARSSIALSLGKSKRASFHEDIDRVREHKNSWNEDATVNPASPQSVYAPESQRGPFVFGPRTRRRRSVLQDMIASAPLTPADNPIAYIGAGIDEIEDKIKAELATLSALKAEENENDEGPDEEPQPATTGTGLPPDLFIDVTYFCLVGLEAAVTEFRSTPEFSSFVHMLMAIDSYPNTEECFSHFRILGKGAFGEVYAVKKLNTGACFAAKYLIKTKVKKKKAEALCWNERDCLSVVHSPFVVSLKYALQSSKQLILMLDLQTGGDLRFHLKNKKRFSMKEAIFFAGEILLGLEHLHSLGFVYRDLKPANVLLDKYGHCRISDLGLSTEYHHKLAGYAGTDGYMAPDMLPTDDSGNYAPKLPDGVRKGRHRHYGYSVDRWSYGCVLYEFISGETPFNNHKARSYARSLPQAEAFKANGGELSSSQCVRFASFYMDLEFDKRLFNKRSINVIRGLLDRDRSRRYTWHKVKSSKLFTASLDWGQLECQALQPPFSPPQNVTQASDADKIDATDLHDVDELDSVSDEQWKPFNLVSLSSFQHELVQWLQWREEHKPVPEKERRNSILAVDPDGLVLPSKSTASIACHVS